MQDIAGLVNELIAAGAEPGAAARIVTLAFVAGHASSDKTDSILEQRRERDRIRKREERALSKDIQGQNHAVPNKQDTEEGERPRTSVESADNADNGSLSPVPLLPPTPPNNPLAPNPSKKSKSARGERLPETWVLTGPNLAYALSKNFSEARIAEMHEQFCAWAWSASGPNAMKRNWDQAWRGWVLREAGKGASARASPTGRPLSPYEQRRQETKDILNDLDNFAQGRRGGGEVSDRILQRYSGDGSEEVRGGFGGTLLDLSATGHREGG